MDIALDPETRVGLADYTWLPAEYQQVFQATLEKEDGVASIHFAAEVERCTDASQRPYTGGSPPRGSVASQLRVIVMSKAAVYVCNARSEISRCLRIEKVEEIFLVDDWICLSVPSEYDLLFRVTPRNLNTNCHQGYFVDAFNALRTKVFRSPVLNPKQLNSMEALTARQLRRPVEDRSGRAYNEEKPLAIPIVPWERLVTYPRADVIIRSLLPRHGAMCSNYSPRRATPVEDRRYASPTKQQQQQQPSSYSPPHAALSRAESPRKRVAVSDVIDPRGKSGSPRAGSPKYRPRDRAHSPQAVARSALAASLEKVATKKKAENGTASRTDHGLNRRLNQSGNSAAGRDTSDRLPRFEDPCLELVWSELMSQRQALETLTHQVQALMEDRYGRNAAGKGELESPPEGFHNHARGRDTAAAGGGSGDWPMQHVEDLTPFQRSLAARQAADTSRRDCGPLNNGDEEFRNRNTTHKFTSPSKRTGASTPISGAPITPRENKTSLMRRFASPQEKLGPRRPVVADFIPGEARDSGHHHQAGNRASRAAEARNVVGSSSGGSASKDDAPRWQR